jgi:hypothetical protein
MTDVFGNYVIQKLFEFGTEEQKTTLCNLLRGKVVNMSMQMYGCRTVQKAIEVLKEDMQLDIVRELKGSVQRYGVAHGLKPCGRGEKAGVSRIIFSCCRQLLVVSGRCWAIWVRSNQLYLHNTASRLRCTTSGR